jgi:hypothetical protein
MSWLVSLQPRIVPIMQTGTAKLSERTTVWNALRRGADIKAECVKKWRFISQFDVHYRVSLSYSRKTKFSTAAKMAFLAF